jgi:hypothetical protein
MSEAIATLRPGLLVALSTSIKGNVEYDKLVLESEHVTVDGAQKARWETERTISIPEEYERAVTVRARARAIVGSVCSATSFGHLCAEENKDKLEAAVAEARQLCADFNASSKLTTISFYVLTGRIAPDDVAAVRAIKGELRDLLADMETGIKTLDTDMVRKAAKQAKQMGSMLTPDAQARVKAAINAARSTATKMVKAGEQAAKEIDRNTLATIRGARTSFLDLDDAGEVAVPVHEARAIDLEPEAIVVAPAQAAARAELEVI